MPCPRPIPIFIENHTIDICPTKQDFVARCGEIAHAAIA